MTLNIISSVQNLSVSIVENMSSASLGRHYQRMWYYNCNYRDGIEGLLKPVNCYDGDSFRLFLGESLSDYSRLYAALQSARLGQFLSFTDLRVRLVYPATDGSEPLDQPRDLVRYYYAIAHIDVVAGLARHMIKLWYSHWRRSWETVEGFRLSTKLGGDTMVACLPKISSCYVHLCVQMLAQCDILI